MATDKALSERLVSEGSEGSERSEGSEGSERSEAPEGSERSESARSSGERKSGRGSRPDALARQSSCPLRRNPHRSRGTGSRVVPSYGSAAAGSRADRRARDSLHFGHPLHWEPPSSNAAHSVATLHPVLVIIESERITDALNEFLFTLSQLRTTIDMVVFQVRQREPRHPVSRVDGTLLKGGGLVQQIKSVLATMEGSKVFKAAGLRAQKRVTKVKSELNRLRTLAVRDRPHVFIQSALFQSLARNGTSAGNALRPLLLTHLPGSRWPARGQRSPRAPCRRTSAETSG